MRTLGALNKDLTAQLKEEQAEEGEEDEANPIAKHIRTEPDEQQVQELRGRR